MGCTLPACRISGASGGGGVDELVIPAGRGNRVLGTVLITPFVVGGLAAIIVGITYIGGDGTDHDFGYVLVVLGGIMMLVFGAALVSHLRSLLSPGLRLTTEGFDLPKYSFAWSDVEDFQFVHGGEGVGDHLRVLYTNGAEQRGPVRRSAVLAKLGQRTAPLYIGLADFDTGGQPLQDIMRRWKNGDRTAGRPTESRPDRVTPASGRTEPELVIPVWRSERIAPVAGSVAFFVVSAAAGPALLGYALLVDHQHPVIWQVIAGIAAWLLVTTFLGGAVYLSLGELRKPGLILYDDRFEYEKHTWWWADIADIRPATGGSDGNAAHGLRAVYRSGISLPSAPADLPFSMAALDTGGRPLEVIMRDWLQRYGTQRRDVD